MATKIKAYYVKKTYNEYGDLIPGYLQPLQLKHYFLLIWPLEIVHEITPASPLWEISPDDLIAERYWQKIINN